MNDTTRTLIALGLAVGIYLLYKQFLEDTSNKLEEWNKRSLDLALDFYNRVESTKDKETTE